MMGKPPAPEQESASASHGQFILERLSDKYDAGERPRVDRIKERNVYAISPEGAGDVREKIATPTFFKKIGRLALDAMGIKIKKVEARREQEAKAVAMRELREESAIRGIIANEEQKDADRRAEIEKDKQNLQDFLSLQNAMADGRQGIINRQHARYETERHQELFERDLNKRLLTVERLEEESLTGEGLVSKRSISYDGRKIPVYDLTGLPFSLLVHNIEYRLIYGEDTPQNDIGVKTALGLRDNPALWSEHFDMAKNATGFATRGADARGTVISASYINSEYNLNSYHHRSGDIIYGFEHVDAGSVLKIANGDGGTPNMQNRPADYFSGVDYRKLQTLEGPNSTNIYNEILLKRYSEETGTPKLPDYIVATNGEISDRILKHANFFGIPIVNIEQKSYITRQFKKGEQLLSEIMSLDDFAGMEEKYLDAQRLQVFRRQLIKNDSIGKADDIRLNRDFERYGIYFEVAKRLQEKRLDFYKKSIKDAISDIEEATQSKRKYCDDMYILLIDTEQKKYSESSTPIMLPTFISPGQTSSVRIRAPFHSKKYGKVQLEDTIYDGEHPFGTEPKPGADSSYYNEFNPIVLQYLRALAANRGMI